MHRPAVQKAADVLLEICHPSSKLQAQNSICRPSLVLHNILQVYHLLVESLVAATGTGILLCRVHTFVLIIALAPIIIAAAAGLRLSFSAYTLQARPCLCPGGCLPRVSCCPTQLNLHACLQWV